MPRTLNLALALCFTTAIIPMHAQATLPIMPLPAHATSGIGNFPINTGFQIRFEGYTEPRLDRARDRFLASLNARTGILHLPAASPSQPSFVIHTDHKSADVQELGEDESYRLEVTPTQVTLSAPNPLGVLHGLQTFLQLIEITPTGYVVPAINIDDKPRFPWRGLMLDTGRHFMPLDTVRQTLDGMEMVKLNVFHWHLSEDQGFRIESKSFPLLQEKGSDGNYYTQDEVRSILAYARDRGIRVIPEFDMPGHATSWFVGYPELSSGPGPYTIERNWGIFDPAMDPTRDSTYQFLDKFLKEMTALFPDAYFHIGGDECNGKQWDRNPRIQQFMHEHNLKDNAALQAYFTARVQKLVTARHKITIGWDEVLQPDTPKDVVIQSWRGQESLADAAKRGYRGLLSNGYYIDLNQSAAYHYSVDPLGGAAASLPPAQQSSILGGEATMWSEFTTPEIVNGRIWPRTAAIAERLWSPQDTTDVTDMYRRLAIVSQELADHGFNYAATSRNMLQRMAGNQDDEALRVLASVVQPPEGYEREELRHYDYYSPLNRMPDAVSPESDRARDFNNLADRIAAGHASNSDFTKARAWLSLWRDNDAQLQAVLPQSSLTAELAPQSRNLSQAAAIGLQALDQLQNHKSDEADPQQQLATLKTFEAPQAVTVLKIIPGIEALVKATNK